ncbi:hypothetical protein JX265_010803 [Neoarthrinium moseri]|uniref:Carbohydrate-binding domain-containing protein n=1 Tax=Neoarthrinium moseri TaxID=1658444 RepID=A0A9Q0AL40_9PEZI|nr:uncharacterized protein JN550_010631 [Neoarthrinium moseri]KAI1841887.1 hypothetical protein JX266_011965 [Neoarthrinium moseri]KAI1858135.1 hypothetical protein JX265_010803 [Neoarthrinium moseri]KAI1862000.1 hypothetical protein JN550_010631 [Neoarthrinium moseri]
MSSTVIIGLLAAIAAPVFGRPGTQQVAAYDAVPSLSVPACPQLGSIKYSQSVPDKSPFPETQVDLCYDDTSLKIDFTAYDEQYFYFNSSHQMNDPIYEYEVMECFVYRGTEDPQTYLEFEVSPNNVTWHAFIYNPSKVRASGAVFDRFFITDPALDGISAATTLDKTNKIWKSSISLPLGFFNVDNGAANGTQWRMNFFRTITSPEIFPNQTLGAWSPPDQANFHMSPFFGHIQFV